MAAAHQAAEDAAGALQDHAEQVHAELTAAFLIALTGASKVVPTTLRATRFHPFRIGEMSIQAAIADAYDADEVQQLANQLRFSTCPLVIEFERQANANEFDNFDAVDAAELRMFAESECPLVRRMRVELARAYADLYADQIAVLEMLDVRRAA
jgi:hypothetical protein